MTKRVALVTGGNKGIGLEVVRQLSQAGMQVVLGARSMERGTAAAQQLQEKGLDVVFLHLDVCDPQSIAAAAQWLQDNGARLDVLVNNAGVALDKFVSVFDLSFATLKQTIDTNVYGVFLVTQAFAPFMVKGGSVVMLSSMLGSLKNMGKSTLAYRMSK